MICKNCPKGRLIRYRGVCRHCYYRLRRDVNSGKTSWAALEESGVTTPAQTARRRSDALWRWMGNA